MFKYLFFDDQKLYRNTNLKREYGKPSLIPTSIFYDGITSTDFRTPFVFLCDDGKYRMVYQGMLESKECFLCLLAVSDDGIRFSPESTLDMLEIENRKAPNELFKITPGGEVAEVFEDLHNLPEERYKMLLCESGENYTIHGSLLTSPDLIHWKRMEGVEWNGGAEPITGVFYNDKRGCFTLLLRPDWGVRRVGYIETKDWRTFTPYELCLQVDSLDTPLKELYGMPAMKYGQYYIGFPLIYNGFTDENTAKYHNGIIESELAYSWDGVHWQRSIRNPFLSGMTEENEKIFGYKNYLCWPSCFRTDKNGDIVIYASTSGKEHGPAFANPEKGRICVYKLKKDRFISLTTANPKEESIVSTRENIWQAGELHINVSCEAVTMAVYESYGYDNTLGAVQPLEGYGHEDCIAFCGDTTDWAPQYKNGKTLDDLSGKTLVFELRIKNGSLYSIQGECIPVMNLEALRYRNFKLLPREKSFI